MKRTSFTLLALFISSFVFAQKGLHVGAQFTPKLPLILNQNTYGQPELEYAPSFGYAVGLELGYHFIDELGLFTGIQYTTQGQKYDDLTDEQRPINRHVMLDYWRVPLYLQFSSGGSIGFYANAGAFFGFLNSASIDYTIGSEDFSTSDASARFTDTDVGLLTGLGGKFQLAEQLYATAGVRFTYSFGDINTEDWQEPNDDGIYEESRNASIGFNLSLAYHFPFD